MSVFTSPGAIALTRTPGASSCASWRVRWISAAFDTLYAPMNGPGRMPPTDTTFSTDAAVLPHPRVPRGACEAQRAGDVGVEDLGDRAEVGVHQRPERGVDRGVVDDDVAAAERVRSSSATAVLGDGRRSPTEPATVHDRRADRRERGRGLLELVGLAGDDRRRRHRPAAARLGDRAADAARPAGDEHDLAVEPQCRPGRSRVDHR